MRRAVVVLLLAAMPGGCAAGGPVREPRVAVHEVGLAVPVPCIPATLPPAPAYTDTGAALKAASGPDERYRLLAGNWFSRDARLALLERLVDNCRRVK